MTTTRRRFRTPKRRRVQFAKSELWLMLACKAQEWSDDVGDRPDARGKHRTIPFAEWGDTPSDPDPFHQLCRTYGMSQADLSKALEQIAAELEARAMRAGYEDAWVGGDPEDWEGS